MRQTFLAVSSEQIESVVVASVSMHAASNPLMKRLHTTAASRGRKSPGEAEERKISRSRRYRCNDDVLPIVRPTKAPECSGFDLDNRVFDGK